MKSGHDKVHLLLDGELSAAEREALLRTIQDDPALMAEYASLDASVRMLTGAPPLQAPEDLTRQVMRRLPEPAAPLVVRVRDYLFRGRTLRWNMAGMLAMLALAAVVTTTAVRRHPAGTAPGQADQPVTVRLNFYAPQAQRVTVAGDFNRWQDDSAPMARQSGGVWTIDIPLRPGTYSYMFVVDGTTWVTDPDADAFQDDGFGSRNAVVRVRT